MSSQPPEETRNLQHHKTLAIARDVLLLFREAGLLFFRLRNEPDGVRRETLAKQAFALLAKAESTSALISPQVAKMLPGKKLDALCSGLRKRINDIMTGDFRHEIRDLEELSDE